MNTLKSLTLLQESCHLFCSKDQKSWCKWKLKKGNGTSNHKSKLNLPKVITEVIEPIF